MAQQANLFGAVITGEGDSSLAPPDAAPAGSQVLGGPSAHDRASLEGWLDQLNIKTGDSAGRYSASSVRWVPDDEVTECPLTKWEFSKSQRKHHCRLCGRCHGCRKWLTCRVCHGCRKCTMHVSPYPCRSALDSPPPHRCSPTATLVIYAGGVFADYVCSKRMLLPVEMICRHPNPALGLDNLHDPQRVCDPCANSAELLQNELTRTFANATMENQIDVRSSARWFNR